MKRRASGRVDEDRGLVKSGSERQTILEIAKTVDRRSF